MRLFLAIFYKLSIAIQSNDILTFFNFVDFFAILGRFKQLTYLMLIKLKNKTMDK